MKDIIKYLNKRLKHDKKKLLTYKIIDISFSIIIALLNISSIIIAAIALSIIVSHGQTNGDDELQRNSSYISVILLCVFMIILFFLNIGIAIYRSNTKMSTYKKVHESLEYLEIKYANGLISEENLIKFIDYMYTEAKSFKKLVILEVIQDEITSPSGGKK
ncbi:hypothetical protein [Mycoplasma sp. 1232]|uniref:hypothetical protein n=1 Tax=Mycoplasma sp. 1232 TaxID=3108527 RepID=UPI002B263E37|nr:hypothetical protein [Mycoplasma sp. 1232]MEA4333497.1 hypothetical protein [Mycoplasma sp. 1232]